MTEKTYPATYTEADIATLGRINALMAQHGYSQAAVARLARTSASSLNQVIAGNYAASPTAILAKVEAAINNAQEGAGLNVTAVETTVYKMAVSACNLARVNKNIAVLSAYVGTGKTYSLRHYTAHHPNTYLLEATPMMTVNTLIKQLARKVLTYDLKGGLEDKFTAIIDAISGTDTLFIFDEAETVTPSVLNTLRRLRDIGRVGIVLSGTEHLRGIIRPERGQFDQIRSRVGFFPATIQAITAEDVAALVQASFGTEDISEDSIVRLHGYCKGSARMLVEGLIAGLHKYREARPITPALIDGVAQKALCLQPIKE